MIETDDQGLLQFLNSAGKPAERKNAPFIVPGGSAFLSNKVYAVTEARHHTNVGRGSGRCRLGFTVYDLEADRLTGIAGKPLVEPSGRIILRGHPDRLLEN